MLRPARVHQRVPKPGRQEAEAVRRSLKAGKGQEKPKRLRVHQGGLGHGS